MSAPATPPVPPSPSAAPDGTRERDGEVPRLPRGRLIKLDLPAIFRIGMVGVVLAAVIGLRRPCSDGLANFVTAFEPAPDAAPVAAEPPLDLERLTEEQIRERFTGEAEPPTAPGTAPAAPPR